MAKRIHLPNATRDFSRNRRRGSRTDFTDGVVVANTRVLASHDRVRRRRNAGTRSASLSHAVSVVCVVRDSVISFSFPRVRVVFSGLLLLFTRPYFPCYRDRLVLIALDTRYSTVPPSVRSIRCDRRRNGLKMAVCDDACAR